MLMHKIGDWIKFRKSVATGKTLIMNVMPDTNDLKKSSTFNNKKSNRLLKLKSFYNLQSFLEAGSSF